MMMVVTLTLIVASIATPIYQTCVVRAREAVLRDDLFTLRALIDRFTLDNGRAPTRLEELVEKGYLGRLPTDPFTGSNETWQVEQEDAPASPQGTAPGIVDVHSGSHDLSLEGTPYSSWYLRIEDSGVRSQERERLDGEQVFEVEREVRKTDNDERLAFLEVFQRSIRVYKFHEALFRVDPDLDDAALLVILPLALNLARFIARRVDFKGDVRGELSHDGELRTRKPLLAHQRCVGTTPVA
jgi:general secretion pathway protein G